MTEVFRKKLVEAYDKKTPTSQNLQQPKLTNTGIR